MTAQPYIAPYNDEPDEVEIGAAPTEYPEWITDGCPGGMTHDETMAELLLPL
jgi:hypothetical protein